MKKIKLTQGKVALVDDGDFEWLSQWKWTYKNGGYAYRSIGSKGHIFLHRAIMKSPKNLEIDHINGNGLDNRRSNLRFATHKQNIRNQQKQKNRTSKYKGVSRPVFNLIDRLTLLDNLKASDYVGVWLEWETIYQLALTLEPDYLCASSTISNQPLWENSWQAVATKIQAQLILIPRANDSISTSKILSDIQN